MKSGIITRSFIIPPNSHPRFLACPLEKITSVFKHISIAVFATTVILHSMDSEQIKSGKHGKTAARPIPYHTPHPNLTGTLSVVCPP